MTRVGVVNMAWDRPGNRELLAAATRGKDVLLIVEALGNGARRPENLALILPPGWAVRQDRGSAARAGSAVAWRTATMQRVGRFDLFLASGEGRRVRERYIASVRLRNRATGDVRPYAAAHAPLKSTGRQDEFYEALNKWLAGNPAAVVGMDTNEKLRRVEATTGRRVAGTEVMGILLPEGAHSRGIEREHSRWTDHPIVSLVLTIVGERPASNTWRARG